MGQPVPMPTSLRTVTAHDFDAVLAQDRPVLVDVGAAWCGPCKLLDPMLERLADDTRDAIDIVKLDAGADPALASRYAVTALPTLLLFSGSRLVARRSGKPGRYAELLELVRALDDAPGARI